MDSKKVSLFTIVMVCLLCLNSCIIKSNKIVKASNEDDALEAVSECNFDSLIRTNFYFNAATGSFGSKHRLDSFLTKNINCLNKMSYKYLLNLNLHRPITNKSRNTVDSVKIWSQLSERNATKRITTVEINYGLDIYLLDFDFSKNDSFLRYNIINTKLLFPIDEVIQK